MREYASALLKIADGLSANHVAQHGLYKKRDPDTLYRWLNKYKAGGLQALVHKQRGHRGFSPSRGRSVEGTDPPTS
jgi:transposase